MTEQGLPELLPCPHCDNDGAHIHGERDGATIYCSNRNCGAKLTAFEPDARKKAVERWNTRPIPAPEPRGEAVRAALVNDLNKFAVRAKAEGWANAVPFLSWEQFDLIVAALALPAAGGVERETVHLSTKWKGEALAHRAANSGGDGAEKGWIIADTLDRCAKELTDASLAKDADT